jgi:hypothetical protein
MSYGWNMCKTRVNALRYRNCKSRVDAPSTSELMFLDSETKLVHAWHNDVCYDLKMMFHV